MRIDDDKIRQFAEELNSEIDVPIGNSNGRIHLERCKPPHALYVNGNREGYLALAEVCLRAAVTPIGVEEPATCLTNRVDLTYQSEQIFIISIDCTRQEEWPETEEFLNDRKSEDQRNQWFTTLFFGSGCLLALMFLIVGMTTVTTAIRDFFRG